MRELLRLALAVGTAAHFAAPGRELDWLRRGPEAYRQWALACADTIFADIRSGVGAAASVELHAYHRSRAWPEPPFLRRLP